jgi:hypothetical protein
MASGGRGRGDCAGREARGRARGARLIALAGLLLACGGSAPPPAASTPAPAPPAQDDPVLRDPELQAVLEEEAEKRAARDAARDAGAANAKSAKADAQVGRTRSVGVRGITGSLTAFEVEAAMNTKRTELLACVARRPRALGHVAGDIAFHVDLDGQGKVERVAVTQSDLGYTPLEECLTSVVASAPFPTPAGAERTETQWRMSVDPLRKAAELVDSAQLEDTIARQSESTYERCEIGKGRRFVVNGYVARGRKLHPVSVRVPWRGPRTRDESPEQLTCLAQALEKWKHWPKGRGFAKVSFELRWVAAPAPSRGRARRKR